MRASSRRTAAIAVAASALAATAPGCALTEMAGAALAYREAELDPARIQRDIPYRDEDGEGAVADEHRLDLFLPDTDTDTDTDTATAPFPVLLFVHGGGWTSGDRAYGALGVYPYQNVGRFYAARGIATAVLSYRLQPEVGWRDQVADVADATAWLARHVADYGGDPRRIALAGHSAGAWLAAWVGLADAPLAARGVDRASLCGLVLVSGAGYDLEDARTWELGASRAYFEDLFADDSPGAPDAWTRDASIARHLAPPLPPALVMNAAGEPARFERQSDVLAAAIDARGGRAQRRTLDGQNHQRIAVSLSREGDPASDAVLAFLADAHCTR
ncbi:MAG: alpha/beta hydrolase [Myxococcota bacterium]